MNVFPACFAAGPARGWSWRAPPRRAGCPRLPDPASKSPAWCRTSGRIVARASVVVAPLTDWRRHAREDPRSARDGAADGQHLARRRRPRPRARRLGALRRRRRARSPTPSSPCWTIRDWQRQLGSRGRRHVTRALRLESDWRRGATLLASSIGLAGRARPSGGPSSRTPPWANHESSTPTAGTTGRVCRACSTSARAHPAATAASSRRSTSGS